MTQQDIQTPLYVISQEVVETIPTATQESISPIHPTITTTHKKNYPLPTNNTAINSQTIRYSNFFSSDSHRLLHNTDINHMNITTLGRYHNQFPSQFFLMKNEKIQNIWNNIDQLLKFYKRDNFEPYMNSEKTRQDNNPSLKDEIPQNQIIKYHDKTKKLKVPRPMHCKNKSHYYFIYNNTKLQKPNLQFLHKYQTQQNYIK